jgi:hypothetical protein
VLYTRAPAGFSWVWLCRRSAAESGRDRKKKKKTLEARKENGSTLHPFFFFAQTLKM